MVKPGSLNLSEWVASVIRDFGDERPVGDFSLIQLPSMSSVTSSTLNVPPLISVGQSINLRNLCAKPNWAVRKALLVIGAPLADW